MTDPGPEKGKRDWDDLGPTATLGELAAAAVAWISDNLDLLLKEAAKRRRGGDRWSPRDAVSLLAGRATGGRGLATGLRKHVSGADPISNPHRMLLYYLSRAIDELREEQRKADRRKRTLDGVDGSIALGVEEETEASYSQVIDFLEAHLDRTARPHDLVDPAEVRRARAHLHEQEAALRKIFDRYQPAEV